MDIRMKINKQIGIALAKTKLKIAQKYIQWRLKKSKIEVIDDRHL